MTSRDELLNLTPSDAKDELGGYVQGRLAASHGYTIATYTWEPKCGFKKAKGVMFLLHGVLGHSTFEWLAPDESNYRVLLKGSLVQRLLALDLVVIAHDQPAHGRSTGLHAYVDSLDHMRDCAIDVIEHMMSREELAGKKKFLTGMSMGGTITIRICQERPDLLDGVILISPAVRPPDDMFGPYGRFLKAISPILGALVPRLPVLKLPPSPDPLIRDAVEKDGLIHRGALRVNMGMEFLRVYSEINDDADNIEFKAMIIFIGSNDNVVSPQGIEQFTKRVKCQDKNYYKMDDIGHDVLKEAGCEPAVEKYIAWVKERI